MDHGKCAPVADHEVAALIASLRERGLTVGTAESCTAGMISARIADIPGSSDVLLGGIVSYSNGVKMKVLGVGEDILRDGKDLRVRLGRSGDRDLLSAQSGVVD